MKKVISILVALFLINGYSTSQAKVKEIIKRADLLLDMMEYEPAIMNYLRASSLNPQRRNIRKKMGYAYFQLGRVNDALRYLKEELTLFPDNGDAYDLFVYVLFESDRIQENFAFLESLDLQTQTDKESPDPGLGDFILGMHFKETENYDKATKYFRKALERGHDPMKYYVQLLDIYLLRIDRSTERPTTDFPIDGLGMVILNEARQNYGGTPSEIYFLFGLRYFENSNWQKARESFEIAARLQPDIDLKDALFNLASIKYNYKDFDKASEYFREIIETNPEDAEVKFYLDCCQKKLDTSLDNNKLMPEPCPKQINSSREFIDRPDRKYKRKFENDPSFVLQNINNLAVELVQSNKFHKALEKFRKGLKISPESPVLNLNTAIVYSWLDNLEEAEKHALLALRKKGFGRVPKSRKRETLTTTKIPLSEWTFWVALEEGNYFSDAYNHLGTIYFKKGEYNKAKSAFRKTIEINPIDARGHFNLGCAYRVLGNRDRAEEEWKLALKYEKESKKHKESGYFSEDQLEIALIVLETRISFKVHKYLGELYLEKGLSDKAIKEFQKAIELEPDDPEPYYGIGKIYYKKAKQNAKYVRETIFYFEKYLYLGGEKEKEVKELLKGLK